MMSPPIKVRYVEWYSDEWLAGTAILNDAERGVYVTICNLIYSRGGPIPREGLAKLCGSHGNRFRRIIERLLHLGKIVENDDEIDVIRCRNELEKSRIRLGKWLENGSKGGRPSRKNKDLTKPSGLCDSRARETTNLTNEKEEERDSSIDESRSGKRIAQQMIEIWNNECGPAGLRAVVKTTAARETACRTRLRKEFSSNLDEWRKYLRRVIGCSFLLGNNPHGFRATFDWVLIPANMAKIVEGNYDDRDVTAPINGNGKQSPANKLYEGAHRAVQARDARRRADIEADDPLLDRRRSCGSAPSTDGRLAG